MMLWLRGGLGLIATLLLLAGAGPMRPADQSALAGAGHGPPEWK